MVRGEGVQVGREPNYNGLGMAWSVEATPPWAPWPLLLPLVYSVHADLEKATLMSYRIYKRIKRPSSRLGKKTWTVSGGETSKGFTVILSMYF